MKAALIQPQFQDADKAREYLEARRWADGPICPHCGVVGEATRLEPKEGTKTHARKGLLKCRACEKQFSVTVGTIFEDSHIPLNKWLMAYHLMSASKKGMSAHQLHGMLGVSYKSAWFMCHRIRYTMNEEPVKGLLAGVVEVDETYVGGKEPKGNRHIAKVKRRRIDNLGQALMDCPNGSLPGPRKWVACGGDEISRRASVGRWWAQSPCRCKSGSPHQELNG
jgi:transposase-like protein